MSHHETAAKPAWADKPIWTDLATSDVAASAAFYSRVFGWQVDVNPDPLYGGYALATLGGKMAAGIGPKQMAEQPTAWSVYIGTPDADALAGQVQAAGGSVIVPTMTVGDQGKMVVFQDPAGAFISAWQPMAMTGFGGDGVGFFGWPELSARGFDKAAKAMPMGEDQPPYYQFGVDGHDVAGGMEMSPMVPAMVPSYWMPYFSVADADASFKTAIDAGATEMVGPMPFPGGEFAIMSDPQGAFFGLMHRVAAA